MIPFANYMERVLYGPAGYYSTGTAKSGKAGDYFTAPDVGPVFGQLLAAIFQAWQKKLAGNTFSVIEVGAGEGRLADDILQAQSFHYVAVERSPSRLDRLKELQKKFERLNICEGMESLKSPPLQGILFGNELIDAFPVHRVRRRRAAFEELYVVENAGAKRPHFQWAQPSTPKLESYFSRLGIQLPDDYETEVNLAMGDWLRAASAVFQKGLLVFIDYGRPAYDYYAAERTRGTLRSFSKHRVSADFLDPAGLVDLTADVDFTSLALDARETGFTPLAFMEMGTFLTMGLELLLKKRDEQQAMAPHPAPSPTGVEGMNRGLKYLLHPEGLGAAFHVLIVGKNIDAAEWTFEHNRLSRLGLPA